MSISKRVSVLEIAIVSGLADVIGISVDHGFS
jgi:hypothetical protein